VRGIIDIDTIIVVSFSMLILCAAYSFGRGPSLGRVVVTRPRADTVDGFGGARAADFMHANQGLVCTNSVFPSSLRTERKKTKTQDAYSHKHEDH
jgi:hypothetical protein